MNLEELIAGFRPLDERDIKQRAEQEALQQAELAWLEERRGMITASKFGLVMQQGRKKDEPFSETAKSYLYEKAAERLGGYIPSMTNRAMQWGTEYEPHAIQEYAAKRQEDVAPNTHSFMRLSKWVGGTPDFLVGGAGVGEVKCPYNPGVHQRTIHEGMIPKEYLWQCHGHMLVTGRDWCDFVSFDPRLPEGSEKRLCVIRLERSDVMLDSLRTKLKAANAFIEKVMEAK